jgi:type VI secretion system protein ImpK
MLPQTGAGAVTAKYRRSDNLALVFQEVLTVIERLRSNRQAVTDPATFRFQIREALKTADQEARNRGYSAEDVQYAIFAVVAFLDESILNLRNPMFADWPRRPLQEEMFGLHVAGEVFFQYLQRLLTRDDSQDLADLLEVYHLCLLMGFAGRYSIGARGELHSIREAVGQKIRRIRGDSGFLSPGWALPPGGPPPSTGDPWVKRLFIVTLCTFALALVLFAAFKLSLDSGVSTLRTLAVQGQASGGR